ncbi:MAG: transglutaminase family protein, partial [Chloroflexi bacterium]|nr:transglutaminase family protein [Chloroflexota bacterium]
MQYRTFTRSGLYQIVALILTVAIFGMALPPKSALARGTVASAPTRAEAPSAASQSAIRTRLTEALELSGLPYQPNDLANLGFNGPNGAPGTMLMSQGVLQPEIEHETAALDQPLSIARVQSAYRAVDATQGLLKVTFAVTNNRPSSFAPQLDASATITETLDDLAGTDPANDPNTIRNVMLTDQLLSSATFVESSIAPDRQDAIYMWNVGDVPASGSVTMTLTLRVPTSAAQTIDLDTGAHVWGTLGGRDVKDQASPVRLLPEVIDGEPIGDWLKRTIDADTHDTFMLAKAAEIGQDPARLFAYVQSLDYEAYKGSLRGTRGTLWGEAGNALDKANLLIAMLRASGVPARYRHGSLSKAQAQQLILAMFPDSAGSLGHVPAGVTRSDPANDAQLLAEAQDHWWVEAYLPGQGWRNLDPSFASAAIGQQIVAAGDVARDGTDRIAEVPDALRHKVTLKVKVEEYHPLNIGSSGLAYSYPLSQTFNALELVGKPVSLRHAVTTNGQGGLVFSVTEHMYKPYLTVGDQTIQQQSFQELLTNFPLGSRQITGEWLTFEIRDPDGKVETSSREVFDKIGAAARQSGGTVSVTSSGGNNPSVSEFDAITTLVATSHIDPRYMQSTLRDLMSSTKTLMALRGEYSDLLSKTNLSPEEQSRLRPLTEAAKETTHKANAAKLLVMATIEDDVAQLGEATLVRAYTTSPRLTLASTITRHDAEQKPSKIDSSLDLLRDEYRMVAAPGQNAGAAIAFQMTLGIAQTEAEAAVMKIFSGKDAVGVPTILDAAAAQNIELVTITAQNLDDLDRLSLSPLAKANITKDVRQGNVVVVPRSMVQVNGQTTVAWWRINSTTGRTIGVLEDGRHGVFEYVLTLTRSATIAAAVTIFLAMLLGEFVEGLLNTCGDVLNGLLLDELIQAGIGFPAAMTYIKTAAKARVLAIALIGALAVGGAGTTGLALLAAGTFLLEALTIVVFAYLGAAIGGKLGEAAGGALGNAGWPICGGD